jgi:hypothetical protein
MGRITSRYSRPLRARDRGNIDSLWQRAAAAELCRWAAAINLPSRTMPWRRAQSKQANFCYTHGSDICEGNSMDIQVLDPQWLANHDQQICAWSSFTVLWSIHHEFISTARIPFGLYRSIEPNCGFTNDAQQQHIMDAIQHSSPLAAFVDHFIQIYSIHNISSRAHNDQPPDARADQAAHTLIHELHCILNDCLPTLIPLSKSLAHGNYGFTSDIQQFLLTSAVVHIEHLVTMHTLLTRWKR